MPAQVTFPLREDVLGELPTADEGASWSADEAYFATFAGDVLMGCVVVTRAAAPVPVPVGPAWWLHGLAVADGYHGQGVGEAVCRAAASHVAKHGGGTLWAEVPRQLLEPGLRHGFAAGGAMPAGTQLLTRVVPAR